ncbi:MAG: hypothetical protein KatS3mg076_1153 [Candidatus Binatia bacterium]|nr:MAG: hypothetical protein KatS3mg076_1153 [Candidatus Binatia bacterium]
MSRTRTTEAGQVLAGVLLLSSVLLPLGALVVYQARTSLLLEQARRGSLEAVHKAEGTLHWAVSRIPPGTEASTLLAGPDGIPGTEDDGVFPFGDPPLGDEVALAVESGAEGFVKITCVASGFRDARARVSVWLAQNGEDLLPLAWQSEENG